MEAMLEGAEIPAVAGSCVFKEGVVEITAGAGFGPQQLRMGRWMAFGELHFWFLFFLGITQQTELRTLPPTPLPFVGVGEPLAS